MIQGDVLNAERGADLLIGVHAEGRRLEDLPAGLVPGDISAAYAIQDATMRRLGASGGWKTSVGRTPDVCSPIPEGRFHPTGARLDATRWIGPRLEVELAVRLGRDLAGRGTCTAEQVADAIEAVVPAFEIATSRFVDRTAVSPLCVIADLQNNEAVVCGAGITDWRGYEMAGFRGELQIDGVVAHDAKPRHQDDTRTVLRSLAWLAEQAAGRGMPLRAGNVVLLGARLMPVPIVPGTTAVATVDGLGTVTAHF